MKLQTLAKIAFSFAVIVLLLYFVDVGKVASALITSDPLLIAGAILLTILGMLLRFIRWEYLIRISGSKLSFADASRIYLIGFFFGVITPSKVGEFVKFRYMHKSHNIPRSTGISLSFVDRVLDMIIVLSIGLTAIPFVYSMNILFAVATFIILFCLMMAALLSKRTFSYFFRKLISIKFLKSRFSSSESTLENIYKPFESIKSPAKMSYLILISLAIWAAFALQAYIIFLALGVQTDFLILFSFVCFGTLAALFPATISGLGTREAAVVFLFAITGIAADKTLSMSLIQFLISQFLVAIAGGLVYASQRSSKKKDAQGQRNIKSF